MRHTIQLLSSQNLRAICFIIITACLSVHPVSGQVSVIKSEFEGREAYALQNSRMRISLLTGGSYIAELRLISSGGKESVNPMFVPHYQTLDPHKYRSEKHGDLYGKGSGAKLMAGYMGHYLCFPYFGGGLSEFEKKAGNGTHGEAFTVEYEIEERMEDDRAVVTASAVLPLTKYSIHRSLTLLPGQSVVLVKEAIENLESFDRPYHYVQHVTFGKPFIEYGKTYVDAPVSRIAFSSQEDDPLNSNTVEWPFVRTEEGSAINAGVFDNEKGEGGYRAWLMHPEREYTWFTMYNLDLNLLVGYVYPKEENPWIGDWKENHRAQALPRDGKTVAWGLEVGTTPFGGSIKQIIDRGPLFNTETYRWIGAKEKKDQTYLIFLLEIGKDFKGVKMLELEEGSIILSEKETATKIRVPHGFTFR